MSQISPEALSAPPPRPVRLPPRPALPRETHLEFEELGLIGEALKRSSEDHGPGKVASRADRLSDRLGRYRHGRAAHRFAFSDLELMREVVGDRLIAQAALHPPSTSNRSGQCARTSALIALLAKLSRLLGVKAATLLPENRVRWSAAIPYALFNVAVVFGIWRYPPRLGDLLLCAVLYAVRMFAVGGGLHRYFSHRSYSTSRAFQFVLGLLASTAGQQGPLWWASAHRHHHRTADTPEDFHSPTQRGFVWAHQLWPFTDRAQRTDWGSIRDLSSFPELRWLNANWAVPHLALVAALWLGGGLRAVVWGFGVSTVLLWQISFTINSLSHLSGGRRFATTDTSRNSWILAILTLGDGWHNNHHFYPGSMRAGFAWWEIDLSAYVIRGLSKVGLVWNIREPPCDVLARGRARQAALGAQSQAGPPLSADAEVSSPLS